MNLYKLHTNPKELYNYNNLEELGIYTGNVISWQHWLELRLDGFNIIFGSFNCSRNNLTSIKGSPDVVTGSFDCSHNRLTLLDGAPNSIGKYFYAYGNKLNPKKLTAEINKYGNKLILE